MDRNVKETLNSGLQKSNFLSQFIQISFALCKQAQQNEQKNYRYLFIHIQGRVALINHFDLCSTWAALRERARKLSLLYVQVRTLFNKNMDLRSAVHRAFNLEMFPKMTFMVTFLGQPVCLICQLLIPFLGLFEKKSVSDTFSRLTQSRTKNF